MRACVAAGSLPAAAGPRRRVTVAAGWGGFHLPRVGAAAASKLTPGKLFVFGLGYTGLGAASFFQQRGWEVAGTVRSEDKVDRLAQRGISAFHFDPTDFDNLGGKALDCLRHATHVLSTVPPDADNDIDPVIMAHAQQLSEHADLFKWVGYISSTSVYGDWEGEWVDETSELRAAGGKGWSRVMAEHEWLALHDNFGLPVHVFRCGGIYGPRRSALDSVQRGGGGSANAARRAQQRYTARCHVYDICQTLEASMRHPRPGAAYNIADDDPADRATVMAFAAELLERRAAGLPLQPAVPGDGPGGWAVPVSSMSAAASGASSSSYDSGDEGGLLSAALRPRDRGASSGRMRRSDARQAAAAAAAVREALAEKRVSNALIKKELGVQLQFPTYREGLSAIAAGDMRPFS
ncbi:NAD(P)-dependent oxidoreductase [Chlorella sorokiniana]|uniref:NAD(P)-dependent oxidoreductase n=1 Tax=Chlorella sorokiniana TaxID=3076 RepID=A0A2P6TLU5_CHLSO|nr:NAD(P)-dependent oxidoreductase [Chlorella sorokiniana]|eukprot:PRW45259.1 NAD(P)-dependent oxidoreductase [Chlorella sorokiniana]